MVEQTARRKVSGDIPVASPLNPAHQSATDGREDEPPLSWPFGHIAGFPDSLLVLILLGISLGLMFAGRTLIKVLAFLVVGLVGATLGAALGTTYLGGIGWILGAVAGFFVGGIVGFLLLALGIGAALGYVSYVITLDIVKSSGAALVAGVVLFVVGVVLYGKILGLVSAVLGGLLFLIWRCPRAWGTLSLQFLQSCSQSRDCGFRVRHLQEQEGEPRRVGPSPQRLVRVSPNVRMKQRNLGSAVGGFPGSFGQPGPAFKLSLQISCPWGGLGIACRAPPVPSQALVQRRGPCTTCGLRARCTRVPGRCWSSPERVRRPSCTSAIASARGGLAC